MCKKVVYVESADGLKTYYGCYPTDDAIDIVIELNSLYASKSVWYGYCTEEEAKELGITSNE